MKSLCQVALASVLIALVNFVPAYAYATKNTGTARTHSQTYHDRTPKAHTHTSHPHHG
jgi:hypothetical protein